MRMVCETEISAPFFSLSDKLLLNDVAQLGITVTLEKKATLSKKSCIITYSSATGDEELKSSFGRL